MNMRSFFRFGISGIMFVMSIMAIGLAGGKPVPPPPPLNLHAFNIITAEPGCSALRLWGNEGSGSNSYVNDWTITGSSVHSVAFGDVDGDGIGEIITSGSCCATKTRSTTTFKIYISAYKQGVAGVWRTTSGDSIANNISDTNSWSSDVVVADLEGDGKDEVILRSANHLAIFKFVNDHFQQAKLVNNTVLNTWWPEILVTKIGENVRIFVACNHQAQNSSEILQFDKDLVSIPFGDKPAIPAGSYLISFAFGDINHDGLPELCASGYQTVGGNADYGLGFVYAFNPMTGTQLAQMAVNTNPYDSNYFAQIAVGDLLREGSGDQLVLAKGFANDIVQIYGLGGGIFSQIGNDYPLMSANRCRVGVNKAYVADSDGDGINELILVGFGSSTCVSNSRYIEVLKYASGTLTPSFAFIGPDGGEIVSAAIGPKLTQ